MRPKIKGSFDFTGEIRRGVNVSNYTLEPFAQNITEALAQSIDGIRAADFIEMNILHMWESPDFILKGWETGFPTLWKLHIFRIDYELVIWNRFIIAEVRQAMEDLHEDWEPYRKKKVIRTYSSVSKNKSNETNATTTTQPPPAWYGSTTRTTFIANLYRIMECGFVEMYTNAFPIMYNETIEAPDSDPMAGWSAASREVPSFIFLLCLLGASILCTQEFQDG